MYYLYILHSEKCDKFYVGFSQDPWKRIDQHNQNDTLKFTGKYKDWKFKAIFQVSEDAKDAIKIERFIKKQKSRKLILRLIDSSFQPDGELAQLVRVPHLRD
jgi:putative endonuclease